VLWTAQHNGAAAAAEEQQVREHHAELSRLPAIHQHDVHAQARCISLIPEQMPLCKQNSLLLLALPSCGNGHQAGVAAEQSALNEH
jgi:hypothetical protein